MFCYRNEPVDGLRGYKVLRVNPTNKWEPLTVKCDYERERDCFAMFQTDYTICKVGTLLQSTTIWGKLDTYFLIESNMEYTSTIKRRVLKNHKKNMAEKNKDQPTPYTKL